MVSISSLNFPCYIYFMLLIRFECKRGLLVLLFNLMKLFHLYSLYVAAGIVMHKGSIPNTRVIVTM